MMSVAIIIALIALLGAIFGPVVGYLLASRKLTEDIRVANANLAAQITQSERQLAAEARINQDQLASQAKINQDQLASHAKIAQDQLVAENRLSISSHEVIRKLLSQTGWDLRTFEAIKVHLRGFEDNELRRLLIAAGALAFDGADSRELWGLLERNETKLPPARVSKRETTPTRVVAAPLAPLRARAAAAAVGDAPVSLSVARILATPSTVSAPRAKR